MDYDLAEFKDEYRARLTTAERVTPYLLPLPRHSDIRVAIYRASTTLPAPTDEGVELWSSDYAQRMLVKPQNAAADCSLVLLLALSMHFRAG